MSFKSIFRKIAAGFLAGVLTVGGLPLVGGIGEVAVSAAEITSGDYQYEVLDDGTISITDYLGASTTVDIPSKIDGKTVTKIGWGAFYNNKLTRA